MLRILLILAMGMLLSCCRPHRTPPPEGVDYFLGEQISPELFYEVVELSDGTLKEVISIEKSVCRSRGYKIGREYIGPAGVVVPLNIKQCNLMFGYSPNEYLRSVNFMKWVKSEINMDSRNGKAFKNEQEQVNDLSFGHSEDY
jgi:hypothetical protein